MTNGTVRKRKDGRWEGRRKAEVLPDGKIKYIYAYAYNPVDCVHRLDEKYNQYFKEKDIIQNCPYLPSTNPTFKEWSELWLKHYCLPKLRPNVYRKYESIMNKHLMQYLGKYRLQEITTTVCQQALTQEMKYGNLKNGKPLSTETVSEIKKILSSCFNVARDIGLIESNPTGSVALPKISKAKRKTMSADEIGIFLEVAKQFGLYEFYCLELSTGLRVGEITALTWDDLDVVNRSVHINKQLQEIGGKLVVVAPKTENSVRSIKLSKFCVDMLMEYKHECQNSNDIMFPSDNGNYMTRRQVIYALHRIQKAAGLEQITFHDLRHTFATLALEQGADIKTVSQMLGHTSAAFTMNVYMNTTLKMQRKVADTMGELMKK